MTYSIVNIGLIRPYSSYKVRRSLVLLIGRIEAGRVYKRE
jgi:hypothetical protein